jgi:two-component system, cell cycle sensor histidine kinase and response regulator CckA
VLTDIMMPSLGGLAIVRTLLKIDPKVKIIAFSGLESNSRLAEAAGVCKFLSKPYTTKELLDTINLVLDR